MALAELGGDGFQRLRSPPGEHDREPVAGKRDRRRPPDAGTRTRDHRDPRHRRTVHCPRTVPVSYGRHHRPLWGHRELAPLLARWHHDEFGYLYDVRIWNHEIATLELEAMAEPGSRDVTWIAFEGPDRRRGFVARIGVADRVRRPARDSRTSAPGWRACTSRPSARSCGPRRPPRRVRHDRGRRPRPRLRPPVHGRAGRLLPGARVADDRRGRPPRRARRRDGQGDQRPRGAPGSELALVLRSRFARRVLVSPRRRHAGAQGAPDATRSSPDCGSPARRPRSTTRRRCTAPGSPASAPPTPRSPPMPVT